MSVELENGYKFHDYTVIDNRTKNINGKTTVKCQCKCGAIRNIGVFVARNGRVKRCIDCYKKTRQKLSLPKIGSKYGNWTVVSGKRKLQGTKNRGIYLFKVKCVCGHTKYTHVYLLNSDRTKSQFCSKCSSQRRVKHHKDLNLSYFNNIKRTAIKRNLAFNITPEYIFKVFEKQNKKCALTGIEIVLSRQINKQYRKLQTASLDRINSKKGYIKGNIQWVVKRINAMKMNLPDEEFIKWCSLVAIHSKKNNQLKNKL